MYRLIVDLIYQAVLAMRQGDEPTAPNVIIINLSLGNPRKPFYTRLSAWARLVDRLSHQFGILFLVSAGNYDNVFDIPTYASMRDFEDADPVDRAKAGYHCSPWADRSTAQAFVTVGVSKRADYWCSKFGFRVR